MCGCIIQRSLSSNWFLLRLATLYHFHLMRHKLVGILRKCARHVAATQPTWVVWAPMPAIQQYEIAQFSPYIYSICTTFVILLFIAFNI